MKSTTSTRHALLATLLAGAATATSVGCMSSTTTLASLNPFHKPDVVGANVDPRPGFSESIASGATKTRNSLASVGTKAKAAVSKTTGSVAGLFTGNKEAAETAVTAKDDPLRLDNRPDKLDPQIFVANGQLWESTGNLPKAMESYSKALEHQPNNAAALSNIARLHFRQGNHQQAEAYFERAIEQNPTDAVLRHDLGLTRSKLGQQATAIEALSQALEMSPQNPRFANNLASVHYEAGDPTASYEVLAKNNPPAVAHFNMAYLHYKHGQVNDARGHLNEAIKFQPLAATDAAVKRAVDRSQEMLAQLNATSNATEMARATPAVDSAPAATKPDAQIAAAVKSATSPTPASPASITTPSPGTGKTYSLPSGFKLPAVK